MIVATIVPNEKYSRLRQNLWKIMKKQHEHAVVTWFWDWNIPWILEILLILNWFSWHHCFFSKEWIAIDPIVFLSMTNFDDGTGMEIYVYGFYCFVEGCCWSSGCFCS
jgi:hypothetical protein